MTLRTSLTTRAATLSPSTLRRLPRSIRTEAIVHKRRALQASTERLTTTTVDRVKLEGPACDTLVADAYLYGAWEPNITAAMLPLLVRTSVMIDVGANVGYYSALANIRKIQRVFAVEPVPSTVELLRKTLELNDATGRVEVLPVAASDVNGTVTIYPSSNPLLSSGLPQDGEPVQVPAVRLCEHIPRNLWSNVNVVKVDVEGFEVQALRGLLPVLQVMPEGSAVFVELNHERLAQAGTSAAELDSLLGNAGFRDRYSIANPYQWEEAATLSRRAPEPLGNALPEGQADLMYVRSHVEGEVAPHWFVPDRLGIH